MMDKDAALKLIEAFIEVSPCPKAVNPVFTEPVPVDGAFWDGVNWLAAILGLLVIDKAFLALPPESQNNLILLSISSAIVRAHADERGPYRQAEGGDAPCH